MAAKSALLATAILATIGVVLSSGPSGPTGVRCGQLTCKPREYCSEIDNRCAPCSIICDSKTHNFDQDLCAKQCRDFFYDTMYVRNEKYESLKETVEQLEASRKWNTVFIIVLSVFMICMILFLLCKYTKVSATIKKWWTSIKKKCSKVKNPSSQDKIPPELKEVSVNPSNPAIMQPLNVQTLNVCSSRQPAEDSSLDNSYVNMAMTPSPDANTSRQPPI